MFGSLIYDLIFFAFPVALVILFAVVLRRYLKAKKANVASPGTFSDEEIKKRKIITIIIAVVTAVVAVMVLCLCALMYVAVAYM